MGARVNAQYKDWEDEYIRENYKNKSDAEMAKEVDRTASTIRMRRNKLRLSRVRHYTAEEDNYIRENYLIKTDAEIAATLDRTANSVLNRRSNIGCRRIGRRGEPPMRCMSREKIKKLKLEVGQKYKIINNSKNISERINGVFRLLNVYERFGLFENHCGVKECFLYTDLVDMEIK